MTGTMADVASGPPSAPAPVPLRFDPRLTALVVMDVNEALCGSRPACVATVPRIAALLAASREAGATIVHTEGGPPPNAFLEPVEPVPGEIVVRGRANKLHATDLEDSLRERGITTLLLAGTAANGAVLYTAFAANLRGFTVAVAVDGISAGDDTITAWVAWQLVNQPGFTNAANEPLAAERVTLTRTDLVTFDARDA